METSKGSSNPPGEDAPAALMHRALNQDEIIDDLLPAVLASDNQWRAWKRVKANQGARGIDGVTIEDCPARAREQWATVRAQISDGRYWPQAVRTRPSVAPRPAARIA